METFRTFDDFDDLKTHVEEFYSGRKIGLVPTMGALHIGHISLVERASKENDFVIVTIFVNPKQFNNKSDLSSYPRTIERDKALLNQFTNVAICIPKENSVYPEPDPYLGVDLGHLDEVLEGCYRPGHFQGVSHVVHNLFYLTNPSSAYFGLKDIQQFAVIKKMNEITGLNIELIGCPTIRSKEGLALSSRNEKLSNEGLRQSLIIIKTLRFVEENKTQYSPDDLKNKAIEFFQDGNLKLEYLDIVNAKTFKQIRNFEEPSVCCIAAYCENIRLIDNVLLESVLDNEKLK